MAETMFEGLQQELTAATFEFWDRWQQKYPEETVYSFGLGTDSLAQSAGGIVMTEQALRRRALDYQKDVYPGRPVEKIAWDLRWSAYDSPHLFEFAEIFRPVETKLNAIYEHNMALPDDSPEFDANIKRLYAIFVGAMNEFRRQRLNNEQDVLLMVWIGDISSDEFDWFLESCNSPERVRRFRAEER